MVECLKSTRSRKSRKSVNLTKFYSEKKIAYTFFSISWMSWVCDFYFFYFFYFLRADDGMHVKIGYPAWRFNILSMLNELKENGNVEAKLNHAVSIQGV